MNKASFAFAILVTACTQKESRPPSPPPSEKPAISVEAPVTNPVSPAVPAASTPTPSSPGGALTMDEARFQKWLSFRKAVNDVYRKGMHTALQAGAAAKEDSAPKAAADVKTMGNAAQELGAQVDALRAQYGFPEKEDKRILDGAIEVVSAKIRENPMMAPTIEMMQKMADQPGPAKESAEKFLKEQDEREQKAVETAIARYGAPAVEVFSKHLKDISYLQTEMIDATFGVGRK